MSRRHWWKYFLKQLNICSFLFAFDSKKNIWFVYGLKLNWMSVSKSKKVLCKILFENSWYKKYCQVKLLWKLFIKLINQYSRKILFKAHQSWNGIFLGTIGPWRCTRFSIRAANPSIMWATSSRALCAWACLSLGFCIHLLNISSSPFNRNRPRNLWWTVLITCSTCLAVRTADPSWHWTTTSWTLDPRARFRQWYLGKAGKK